MDSVVKFKTHRSDYDIRESMESAVTVSDLIAFLLFLPADAKVVFDNDNGYTFGGITTSCIKLANVESKEEELERLAREEKEYEQEDKARSIRYIKRIVNKHDGELILAMDGILLQYTFDDDHRDDLIVTEVTTKIDGKLYGNTNWGLIDLEETITELSDWYTLEDVVGGLK